MEMSGLTLIEIGTLELLKMETILCFVLLYWSSKSCDHVDCLNCVIL